MNQLDYTEKLKDVIETYGCKCDVEWIPADPEHSVSERSLSLIDVCPVILNGSI